jgi:hypothetical protein
MQPTTCVELCTGSVKSKLHHILQTEANGGEELPLHRHRLLTLVVFDQKLKSSKKKSRSRECQTSFPNPDVNFLCIYKIVFITP